MLGILLYAGILAAGLFTLPQTVSAGSGTDSPRTAFGSRGKDDALEKIMRLLGTDSPESLDDSEVDRLSAFLDKPLEINSAPGSRLMESGLLSQYQVASLLDYRERSGDILSLTELASLDGFPEEAVTALAPFLSLDSESVPGRASVKVRKIYNDLIFKTNVRHSGDGTGFAYGMKYRSVISDRFQLGITANRSYQDEYPYPSAGSFYLALYGRRHLGKIVIGDYSLRYGQGLALWNGFRMSSLSSPESFYLKPSGISPYWSYSGEGSGRGVAADFNIGRFVISSSLALDGLREAMSGDRDRVLSLLPVLNVSWYGPDVQLAVTGYAGTPLDDSGMSSAGCSADFRCCIRGVDLFGEVALDVLSMKPSAIAGSVFNAGENVVLACRGGYSDGQYSLAAGGRFSCGDMVGLQGQTGFGSSVSRLSGTFTAEASYHTEPKYGSDGPAMQLKCLMNCTFQVSPAFALAVRLSERLRNGTERNKTDLRADIRYASGDWMASMRLNALYNKSLGLLGYVEGGWRPDRMSVWLRAGIFRIDNWSDRIYAYERDAPGNFNVPAYYGRGYWIALTAGFRLVRWCKAYLRVSTLQYPWISPVSSERIPRSECRILLSFSL